MDLFRSEAFAQRVNYLLKEHHAPGVAIALIHNDYIHSSAYGYASLDPLTLCRTDTLFDIASCSKSFTSASIGLLVDDEESFPEVKYDAVMADLLPGDFILPEASLQITLDDVVSHRTGMGR
ncbi:hypothetical protein H072_9855 [Dactylellina haptotyla CBS 200.50]|uniref:Beta-lactamase-related domain-containing protein n=1 Tax=Dactylellina haptotyla (strain CBS 200.50) TaxID=1284197 RepID=S8A1L7_DACHA|nr:hypothetical protein H072_9855 [Dactylellina haptotyla CBS 200.50]